MSNGHYDLIVVGAGSAGLPCAIEAAATGGRVLLLDKSDQVGGTLHLSGGHFSAAGARRQRERGIEDSIEAHFADVLRISRDTVRRDLVSQALELAAGLVDWLDDSGFDFAPETPRIVHGHDPYGIPRTYYGVDEARSLLALFQRLLEPHVRSGAVDLRLGSRVNALVAEGGRVTGVEFAGSNGATVARGPATVLASGGFGASPGLFEELHSRPLVSAARETSTGDGLQMARELGGAVVGRNKYMTTFGGLPQAEDPGRAQWADRPLLVAAERPPWEIYVDRGGRRFVAEDEPSMHAKEEALAGIEDLTFFTIFDDRAVDESPDIVIDWSPDHLRAQAGHRMGVSVGDTLPELAHHAGVEPATLAATVERYNRALREGAEDEFGRTVRPAPIERPPFYAMQNHGLTLIGFAGVDVDSSLRVRRADGSTIAGLYAAGEMLGAAATCGKAFCSGMVLTPAMAFGRLLGGRLGGGHGSPGPPAPERGAR